MEHRHSAGTARRAGLALALWLAFALAFLGATIGFADPSIADVFASLEIELPAVTSGALALGTDLRTGIGALVAALALLLSAVPFLLGARGPRARRAYGALAVAALFAAGVVWFAGPLPIRKLAAKMDPTADRSLRPEGYAELGMPEIDRPWCAQDYQVAYQVLSEIAPYDVARLPDARSATSRLVLERMCDPANLACLSDASRLLPQRMEAVLALLGASNGIFKCYAFAQSEDGRHAVNTMRLAGFLLHVFGASLAVVDEFVETLDRDDAGYASRMEGLKRMKVGIGQTLRGNLIMLGEVDVYDTESRVRFASDLAAMYPTLVRLLPDSVSEELNGTLSRLVEKETDDRIRASLVRSLGEAPHANLR